MECRTDTVPGEQRRAGELCRQLTNNAAPVLPAHRRPASVHGPGGSETKGTHSETTAASTTAAANEAATTAAPETEATTAAAPNGPGDETSAAASAEAIGNIAGFPGN
ncbi:MAG: hypothetical protein ACLU48_04505 [Clostridiaceae bacterium]